MYPRKRPKYPNRQRRARRVLPLVCALGAAVLLSAFGLWLFGGETDPVNEGLRDLARDVAAADSARPAPPPAARPAQPGARPTAASRSATSSAPPAVPPNAPPARGGRTAPAGAQTPPAARPATPPVPPAPVPTDANGPSLWNLPFAGHSYGEIAAEMTRRHGGRPRDWAEKMPGITDRISPEPKGGNPTVALTLDACSGAFDAELVTFLRERGIPATLFVTNRWLKTNAETFKILSKDPLFEIAAHGSEHKPCSVDGHSAYGIKGTASMRELVEEVEGNCRELHRSGAPRPRWFRSGTAFYDDIAVAVIRDLGLGVAGYSIAVDEGASLPADKVREKTLAAKNGDILLAHMNHPESGTRRGLMEALPLLQEKGYVFIRLSDR